MSFCLGLRSNGPYIVRSVKRCLHRRQRLLKCYKHCSSSSSTDTKSTVDENEKQKFVALSQAWWDEVGEFDALHAMNDLRVPMVRDAVYSQLERKGVASGSKSKPLTGSHILDVGCGGGILSEPLARLGANVTGIDMVDENIKIAECHSSDDSELLSQLSYQCTSPENLYHTHAQHFDAVVASEVAEHVSDLAAFVETCGKLVKPGGSFLLTTINKTFMSYALALVAAERILNMVPPGTHEYDKLVPPKDLQYLLEKNNFTVRWLHGMWYNPLTRNWSWSRITSMNYAIHAMKAETPSNQDEEHTTEA